MGMSVVVFVLYFAGSMRKKKLVQKILSPIFKSSSQEEEISSQATIPTGEVPQSPDVIDPYLPDLSQRLVDIDAALFAREITLIDKELFIRIPWPELSNCGWMTKDKVRYFHRIFRLLCFLNNNNNDDDDDDDDNNDNDNINDNNIVNDIVNDNNNNTSNQYLKTSQKGFKYYILKIMLKISEPNDGESTSKH